MKRRFSELVEVSKLQKLLDSLYKFTGVGCNVVDNNLVVLARSGWTDMCLNFHRANPETEMNCFKSAQKIFDNIHKEPYIAYKCLNGLYDCVCPIMVEGEHIASLFVAQFMLETPDEEFFRGQARTYGFDEKAYIDALRKVPVLKEEELVKIMRLSADLATVLADLGLQRIRQLEAFEELNKSKESLRESEEKYRSLVNNLRVGVCRNTADYEGRFIQANPAIAKIFGYDSVEEFMDVSTASLYQKPEDRRRFIEDVTYNGFIRDRQLALRKKDGTPIWCACNTNAEYDRDGNVKWLDTVIEDVTAKKLADVRLKTANKQLMDIIEFLPDATLIIDSNKKVLAWNRAMEEMTGISKEDIIGKDQYQCAVPFYGEPRPYLMDLFNKEDEIIKYGYNNVQRKGNILYAEAYTPALYGGKGAYVWVTASCLLDSEGNIVGAIESIRDITDRKQAEEALRQARDELEIKVDQRTQELSAANEELTAMNEELLAMNQELQSINHELHNEITERQRIEEELANTNKELVQAINDLKAMQDCLVRSEKMAALGNLVAGVAHEINTPIGIGVTAASHLKYLTGDFMRICAQGMPNDQYLIEYLQDLEQSSNIILKNMERAGKLIQSFKQVSVDQSSEMNRLFRVKAYLEEILLSMHPRLKRTKHKITVECDETLEFDASPGAFSQIITNLIINAVTHAYSPEDEGNIRIEFRKKDMHYLLVCEDDGKGMEHNVVYRIFDPFFTTKRGVGGTGLGLYIVYNIVTQNFGGLIECDSKLGKGTTFRIRLPFQKQELCAEM